MSNPAKLDILIDIKARLDELLKSQEAFRQTKAEAQSFGSMLKTGLGIDIARRGLDMLKQVVMESVVASFKLASQLKDVSENLQIATEPLQVLTELAKANGGEFETLTQAITTYRGVMASAREGNAAAAGTFRSLGLDLETLSQLPVERQLEQVARAIHQSDRAGTAFDNTVKLLGTRNAPKLTQSLRELAEQGYDKIAASAKEAGQVMSESTIARLDRAQRILEEFKRRSTIVAGEAMGYLGGLFGMDIPAAPKMTQGDGSAAAAEQSRRNQIESAKAYLAVIEQQSQIAVSDPTLVESKRRERLVELLREEIRVRESLEQFLEKNPDSKGDPIAAEAQLAELSAAVRAAENKIIELRGVHSTGMAGGMGGSLGARRRASALENITDEARGVNDPAVNKSWLSVEGGMQAGVMQWATQLGSSGEQVSAALQGTLGATVGNISEQLTAAITQTQTWGQALSGVWHGFLTSMLQAFTQMVAQYAVKKAAMFAVDTLFAAKSLALSLAGAAKSLVAWIPAAIAAAISSYGVAAIIGAAAVVGAVAAFREQGGPVEAGRPYIVGEKRPEVFVPNESGVIVPSVDAYRVQQRRASGGSFAGGGSSGAMTGRQRMLVVYTDHAQTVEGLKRRPDFEALVIDIGRRNRGEMLG